MIKPASLKFARAAAEAADDKQGIDIVALDVRDATSVAEVFMFIGGNSHVHVGAIEDAIREKMKESGIDLKRTDGIRGQGWRVLDYGLMLVHIMDPATREFYSLERLWQQGKKISLKMPAKSPAGKKRAPRKKKKTKKKKK